MIILLFFLGRKKTCFVFVLGSKSQEMNATWFANTLPHDDFLHLRKNHRLSFSFERLMHRLPIFLL